jgi:hypothetical protein
VTFTYPSWDDWRRDLEAHGMLVDLKQNTSAEAYEHMLEEMRHVLATHGHADQGRVAYDAEYLEIQVHPEA